MKLTTRCGRAAVEGCNGALLAKAVEAKLLRTRPVACGDHRALADVAYPTDSGSVGQRGAPDRRDRKTDPGRRRGRLCRAVDDLTGLLAATRRIADPAAAVPATVGIHQLSACRSWSGRDRGYRHSSQGRGIDHRACVRAATAFRESLSTSCPQDDPA